MGTLGILISLALLMYLAYRGINVLILAPASIGAKGQVTVRGIKLHRDVYYTRSGTDHGKADIYYVQPGHTLCLGDNSAQSSDSRKWGTVPDRLMLGKAVFVFWPAMPNNRIGFIK